MRTLEVVLFTMIMITASNVLAELPDRLLVGYWHNWSYPNTLTLLEVPAEYDVINVAFATPTMPNGAMMQFSPSSGIYSNGQAFIADVQTLHSEGKKVVISIGGANDPIVLENALDVETFVTTMSSIISLYGFDGLDVDLEGASLFLDTGDLDYQHPTTPEIVNMINALGQIGNEFSDDFILSMAPETAFVQGAYGYYGGIWGAYLPLIHGLRDQLTYLHVQHYNTGSMYGLDGGVYEPATGDFHVAMAEMLIEGFEIYGGLMFEGLPANKIMIGLPASPSAAGSGYTTPSLVHTALNYLVLGESFGGSYELANPAGHLIFRGLMTWSINWDVAHNSEFALSHRPYLDGLGAATGLEAGATAEIIASLHNYPNPFRQATTIHYQLDRSQLIDLSIYNAAGQVVTNLVRAYQPAGVYELEWSGQNHTGLPVSSGIYFYVLKTNSDEQSGRMILLH